MDSLKDAYDRDRSPSAFPISSGRRAARKSSAAVIADLVAAAAAVDTHTAVYDLEPGHSRAEPRVRRIKKPRTRCIPPST